MVDEALRYVAHLLGPRFLAYVANVPTEAVINRVDADLQSLGDEHERALMDVLEQASAWAPLPGSPATLAFPDGNKPDGSPADRMRRFGWVDMDTEQSWANIARARAGGSLPEIPLGLDATERALAAAAADYFPITLIPVPRPDQPFGELPVISHARTETFVTAVSAEGTLDRLMDERNQYYLSSGFGFTGQGPVRMLGLIVADAEQQVRAFGEDTPAAFIERALAGLGTVRSLDEEGRAEVPAQIGFGGLDLEATLELAGPRGGQLRAARDTDLHVPVSTQTSMVLETVAPLRIHFGELPPDGGPFYEGWEALDLDAQQVSLAGLLAAPEIEGEPRGLPLKTWTKLFDPLSPFVGSFSREPPAMRVVAFDSANVAEMRTWIERIEAHYHPSVRVAVARTISAYAERGTPEDALIDLVIALESLFGGSTELSFRISTAVGWLLGANVDERQTIQREAKAIYNDRSRLVHGEELAEEQASRSQRAAERLIVGVFRALLDSRPELLADRERAARLILGD